MFGHIEGVKIGQVFPSRRALHNSGVHRGLMRGISPEGASIVLSGGYVDDEDNGEIIVYTGEGGRDANTGRQIADQTLTGGNAALATNYIEGNPVRVSRGSQLDSEYAPETGYRYDGLYRIDSYWNEKGKDDFNVLRFNLVRLDGQLPLGKIGEANLQDSAEHEVVGNEGPGRQDITVSRVIRNTAVGNEVKNIYGYRCQICSIELNTPSGRYAECCHIRPLGRPHNGPDTLDNVLCLCPNHHVLFDAHAFCINDDLTVAETGQQLFVHSSHQVNTAHIRYHRNLTPQT